MGNYVCETDRSLGEKVDEHTKSLMKGDKKSALGQHQVQTGHSMDNKPLMKHITVVYRESKDLHRKVLEAIHIKLRGATLNCNHGLYIMTYLCCFYRWRRGRGKRCTSVLEWLIAIEILDVNALY